MGQLFNKVLPMEMLAQLPRPFVHRLRDIRIKQLEEQHKEQESMMKQQEQARNNLSRAQNNVASSPSFAGAALEDFIDELT